MICVIGWNIFAEYLELVGKLPEACESLPKTTLTVVSKLLSKAIFRLRRTIPGSGLHSLYFV